MAAVSETIVREYFELHGFLVRQPRKYAAPTKGEDEEFDFFVANPRPQPADSLLPAILTSADLSRITRAVVFVKGWHTETFSPAMLAQSPDMFRFVDAEIAKQTARFFGDERAVTRILVVPALPQNAEAREQSLEILRGKGIDTVIPFRTLLADLVAETEANRNYQKSDVLQVIRLLKNYDFLKGPQLELFKSPRNRARKGSSV